MASLIKTIRRNQKLMLAGLTLMAMLSFVFLPVIGDILELRGGARDPVIVRTNKYGSLRRHDMEGLLWQRGRWTGFLRELQELLVAHGGRPFLLASGDRLTFLRVFPLEEVGPVTEESVVETWLLGLRAREMGLTVSNAVINQFISDLTEKRVPAQEIKRLLKGLQLSQTSLFEIARNELSALRLRQLLTVTMVPKMPFWDQDVFGMTPAQRWDYFCRLRRVASVEAVPIAAAQYVDEVPDPPQGELKSFFEQYKTRRPDPNSPEPGFREPHTIDVEYFKADLRAFVAKVSAEPGAVSEEAIQAYYNQHKDEFRQRDWPTTEPPPAKTPEEPSKSPPEPGKPEGPAPEPPGSAPAKAEPAKPSPPKPAPAELAPPKPEPPTPTPPEAESPGHQGKKTPSEELLPGDQRPASSSSGLDRTGMVRLVSYQQDHAGQKEAALEPGTKPQASAAGQTPAPEAQKPPKPEGAGRSELAPSKAAAAPPAPVPSKPEDKPPAAKRAPLSAGPEKAEPLPLEKVSSQIRDRLVRQTAEQRIQDALKPVREEMGKFQNIWMGYDQLDARAKQAEDPPEPPDLGMLADRHGLKPGRTGWISEVEAAEWDIGRSVEADSRLPFIDLAFGSLPLYQPFTAVDADGNHYLFWKRGDSPERVPEWTEPGLRQRVLEAWKLVRAREPARQQAQRLAEEARRSGKSLKQIAAGKPGLTVLMPEPFSWLSYRSAVGGLAQLSEVRGLKQVGERFMEAVFGLPPGGIGLAENEPQTTIYVVRVIDYRPSENELWNDFLASRSGWGANQTAALYDQSGANQAWKRRLEAEVGLRWEREPIRGRRQAEFD